MKTILLCMLVCIAVFGNPCPPKPTPPPPPPPPAPGPVEPTPAPPGSTPAPAPAQPTLRSAKITFIIPDGDDKDDNTTVSATITSKVNNQFDMRIASLEGFGGQQTWEDDGAHSYSYNLNVAGGIKLSDVTGGGIKTKLNWNPTGNDRGYFNYRLVLTFDDDNPSTAPVDLEQTNPSLIEMSQGIREYTNP